MQSTKRTSLLGWTVLLLALSAAPAPAQGLFYREVEREGRIYVFNDMEAFARWEQSGDAGKGIKRADFGPNGETVVFDTEAAINAYLFRHDRPGEVLARTPEKKPRLNVTWKDGKTTIETDFSSLALVNRVQARFFAIDPETQDADTVPSFQIRRFETRIEGWFFDPRLTADLELSWRDTRLINDINLNYDISGNRAFMVRAGQFRVPFGRQELTSSMSQQFTDRAIASGEFALGRDLGVQLWGELLNRKIEYRAGVFNGAGYGVGIGGNDNTKLDYVARLQWQPFGDVKYSESDFETSDRFPVLLAVAAEYENNDRRGTTANEDLKRETLGLDATLKTHGLFLFSEYFSSTRTGETVSEFTATGLTVQGGYQLVRYRFEVGGRFSRVDPDADVDANSRSEYGGFAAYYWNKHPLKLVADLRQIKDDAKAEGERKTTELRTTLQFLF